MKKIVLILFSAFICQISFAQQDTASVDLNEVEITAYRADSKTPVTHKNILKSDIDLVNVGQEPSAILWYTPSMTATSDAGNFYGYSYFRLRGIDQTRINMTLDGIPLNEPEDQGAYFSNYPDFFNSLSSIQIQRGVGISSNGVSSYAGSINFASPNLFSEKSSSVEAGINYGSFNTGRLYAEYNSGKSDKGYSAYLRASSISTDGYVDNAYHNGKSVFYGFGRAFGDNRLKLVGFIGNQQNGMAWIGATQEMLNESSTANGNSPDERDDFTQSLVSVQYSRLFSNARINVTGYYNYLNGNYDVDFANFGDTTGFFQRIGLLHNYYGLFANVTHYFDKLKLTYGAHYNMFSREHHGAERTIGNLYMNTGYKNEFNAFTKAEYQIGNLLIYGDLQVRHVTFDYDGSVTFEQLDWLFFNPKVGASYTIADDYNIYYSFGSSGREPTRNDMFAGFDNLEEGVFSPVKPEYVQDHEFGLRVQKNRFYAQINGYYMDFENEITLLGAIGPNSLVLSGNVSNSYRFGVEIDAAYKVTDDLELNVQFTQSENKIIAESGEKINHVLTPSTIFNYGANYQLKRFLFAFQGKYQGESYLDLANSETINGFSVLNLRVAYDHKEANLTYAIGLNNITNETYNTAGYVLDYDPTDGVVNDEVRYFRQAPFNVMASIVMRFE